jgi:hypothetical protein
VTGQIADVIEIIEMHERGGVYLVGSVARH